MSDVFMHHVLPFDLFARHFEFTSMHESTAADFARISPEEFVNFNKRWDAVWGGNEVLLHFPSTTVGFVRLDLLL